ncbi:MAG: HAD family phosphatase, partial [Spirochaetaceae bacterium]|nr:HAD family phosphatase [Spirochaetaceae bacterium]
MSIKAVIFDFGNVISKTQPNTCFYDMAKLTGIPAEIFLQAMGQARSAFDLGEINAAELYSRILKANGYTAESEDMALCQKLGDMDLSSWNDINEQVSDWALALQKQGYKLGILSNMPYEFLERYRTGIPPFVKADYAVFSCDIHIIKPDARIYKLVLQGLNVKPEEAVFFDDLSKNIEAEKALGI